MKLPIEMAVILAVGAVVALVGNQFQSEDGYVELGRQYYEAEKRKQERENLPADPSTTTPSGTETVDVSSNQASTQPADPATNSTGGGTTDPAPDPGTVDVEMPATFEGFTLSTIDDVEFFSDPAMAEDAVIIDVRHPDDYAEGHIPGALSMSARKMPEVWPSIQDIVLGDLISEVIVYCNGGDCSDSVSAAIFLEEQGVPLANLRVYKGGIKEWRDNGKPIVTGTERR